MNQSEPRRWMTSAELDDATFSPTAEIDLRRGYFEAALDLVWRIEELKRMGYSRPAEIFSILQWYLVVIVMPWAYRGRMWGDQTPDPLEECPGLEAIEWLKPWYERRHEVFARDGFCCVECGARQKLEADHKKPVREGGLPTLENLQTLCKVCNRKKR